MTLGIKAFGASIGIGDGGSPESFTPIDEVFSLGPVGGGKELVDFTNHDSVGMYEYQVFDLKDGKEITVEANHINGNTSQGLIRSADAASSVDNYQILGRDGNGFQFPGVIMSLETDFSELKGRVVFRFTVKIAGTIIPIAAASPAP